MVVPYECIWDLRPEEETTFWTAATYFVTEDSTPTVVRLGMERGGDLGLDRSLLCSGGLCGRRPCRKSQLAMSIVTAVQIQNCEVSTRQLKIQKYDV